jgi:plasmid stabilization system protein ParE
MPRITLKYSPVALDMIGAIHRYIADELQNPAGADNTVSFIRRRLELLKISPEGGALLSSRFDDVPDAYRDARLLVCVNYITVYRYKRDTNAAEILRIYHGAQDYVRHLIEG